MKKEKIRYQIVSGNDENQTFIWFDDSTKTFIKYSPDGKEEDFSIAFELAATNRKRRRFFAEMQEFLQRQANDLGLVNITLYAYEEIKKIRENYKEYTRNL